VKSSAPNLLRKHLRQSHLQMKEEVEVYRTKLALKLHFKNTGCLTLANRPAIHSIVQLRMSKRAQCPAILKWYWFLSKKVQSYWYEYPTPWWQFCRIVIVECGLGHQRKSLAHFSLALGQNQISIAWLLIYNTVIRCLYPQNEGVENWPLRPALTRERFLQTLRFGRTYGSVAIYTQQPSCRAPIWKGINIQAE